ncbi:hypothetical protein ScPMuIL_002102 [Solemya velum]
MPNESILDLSELITVRGAGGNILPYKGYMDLDITIDDVDCSVPTLVMLSDRPPDIPLIVGTNLLSLIYKGKIGEESNLQPALQTLVQNMAKVDVDVLGKVKTTRETTILPGQIGTVKGLSRACSGIRSCRMTVLTEDCHTEALPGGLRVIPSAVDILPQGTSTSRIFVDVMNTSSKPITIPGKHTLCQLERVEVVHEGADTASNHDDGSQINNIPTQALIDTGSQVTTISSDFVAHHMPNESILDLSELITVRGAGGNILPYKGYMDLDITIDDVDCSVPTLVMLSDRPPDIPLIVGTNLLSLIYKALPGGLRVIPSAVDILPQGTSTSRIFVDVMNTSSKPITIPGKHTLCQLERVEVVHEGADTASNHDDGSEVNSSIFDHFTFPEDPHQAQTLKDLLSKWKDVFAFRDDDHGHTDAVKHHINLTNPTPIKLRHRRIPPALYAEVRDHLNKMLKDGDISPSKSPWSFPVVLVRRKDKRLRFCVDYRELNRRTIKDALSLPCITETLDSLIGSKYFSCLDLKNGFWQIELAEEDKEKTAFTVGPLGFYQFNSMPFGLTNSPSTFQRLMQTCMGDLHLSICLLFLDDIIVYSRTWEEHLSRLEAVFQRLRNYGLKLTPKKCHFAKTEVKYLGHVVSEEGIQTDPEKVSAVVNWPVPTSTKTVQQFIGFIGFYRRYIKGFSKISQPLHDLLKKQKNGKRKYIEFRWGEAQQKAFDDLKKKLTTAPILGYADFSLPFELHVDASSHGLGAVLCQEQEGKMRVIAYASRGVTKSEKNYPAHKLEFLALKWAMVEKYHDYLYGHTFSSEDDVISSVIAHLRAGTFPSREILKNNPDLRKFTVHWKKLSFRDGVLVKNREEKGQVQQQVVIPNASINTILNLCHDQMAHPGREKTFKIVSQRFFWPCMYSTVDVWVRNCRRCTCRKALPQKAALEPILTTQPLELVCMDFLQVEPSSGYEHLLVITDHFTKFARVIPTKNETALTTARVLYDNFITIYGFPQRLHSDQGPNFESKVIKELCKICNVEKSRTTCYHAMGNGACERMNRTLLKLLGTLENEQKGSWKKHLPTLVHYYNCTPHETTGYSPYKLMFGRDPKLPIDTMFGLDYEAELASYTEYIRKLKDEMEYCNRLVEKHAREAAEKNKAEYDKRLRGYPIEIGDQVLIRRTGIKALIDTGSQVTTISSDFVAQHMPNESILDLSELITVRGAGGNILPYKGYMDLDITIDDVDCSVPTLVMLSDRPPDIPLIVGTNLLSLIYKGKIGEESNLQPALQTLVQNMAKVDVDVLGKVKTTRETTILPGQIGTVKGLSRACSGIRSCRMTVLTEDCHTEALPGGLRVIPSAVDILPQGTSTSRIFVDVMNTSSKPITIPGKHTLCQLERVEVVHEGADTASNHDDGSESICELDTTPAILTLSASTKSLEPLELAKTPVFEPVDVVKIQSEDDVISSVIAHLRAGTFPSREILKNNPDLRKFTVHWKKLSFRDGVLVKIEKKKVKFNNRSLFQMLASIQF